MALVLIVDPGFWKLLTSYSGYAAVGFLVVTLSFTPLKTIWPQLMIITILNRHRRELGVASFFYATIHIACFIIKRGGIMETLPYAIHPALISVVWVAYPIFLILALTSNQYSVKKLGFAKWKKIHKAVYLAEAAIIIHMVLVGQAFWATVIFIPLLILQVINWRDKKRKG